MDSAIGQMLEAPRQPDVAACRVSHWDAQHPARHVLDGCPRQDVTTPPCFSFMIPLVALALTSLLCVIEHGVVARHGVQMKAGSMFFESIAILAKLPQGSDAKPPAHSVSHAMGSGAAGGI